MSNPQALAAAAAVAARINATLAMRSPQALAAAQAAAAAAAVAALPPKTHFEQDIDINHSRIRHVLVKGGTHSQIHSATGASVITRGRYKPIGDCSTEQPLHLHVTADSQEKLDKAVASIKSMMVTEPLKAFVCSGKVVIGQEPPLGFDVAEEVQGPQLSFFKHITSETGAFLVLRGRMAPPPHNDQNEPTQVYIGGPTKVSVEAASALVENLLVAVRGKIEQFIASMPPPMPTPAYPPQPYPGQAPPMYPGMHAPPGGQPPSMPGGYPMQPQGGGFGGGNQFGGNQYGGNQYGGGGGRGPPQRGGGGRYNNNNNSKQSYNSVAPPPSIQSTAHQVMNEIRTPDPRGPGGMGMGGPPGGGAPAPQPQAAAPPPQRRRFREALEDEAQQPPAKHPRPGFQEQAPPQNSNPGSAMPPPAPRQPKPQPPPNPTLLGILAPYADAD